MNEPQRFNIFYSSTFFDPFQPLSSLYKISNIQNKWRTDSVLQTFRLLICLVLVFIFWQKAGENSLWNFHFNLVISTFCISEFCQIISVLMSHLTLAISVSSGKFFFYSDAILFVTDTNQTNNNLKFTAKIHHVSHPSSFWTFFANTQNKHPPLHNISPAARQPRFVPENQLKE